MSKFIKKVSVEVSVNCWETLAVESSATAEATKVVNTKTLKKELKSVLTNTLHKKGLHPGKVNIFIYEEVDDEID